MGKGARFAGLLALAIVAGCSRRFLPGAGPRATIVALGSNAPTPAPPPTAVVQSLPYPARAIWSGHGGALALVAQGSCQTTLYDVAAGRVTAQLPACSLTPDPHGDRFLVQYPTGWLEMRSRGGASATTLVTDDPVSGSPVWSPDGAHLAVLRSDAILLLDPDTGHAVRTVRVQDAHELGRAGYGMNPVGWSADGAYALVAEPGRGWIVGLAGEGSQTALDCLPVRAQFAPRGDALGVECGGNQGGRVWDARQGRVIAKLPHFWGWSSTGRYATAFDSGLVLHDGVTGAVVLRIDGADSGSVAFSPDDRWLTLTSPDVHGNAQLVVLDVASGKQVVRREGLLAPQWSADGAYLLTAQVQGDRAQALVLESGTWKEHWSRAARYGEWAWAPVGARLVLTSFAFGTDIVDMDTGATHPVGGAEAARFTRLEVAPDGAVVAHLQPRVPGRPDPGPCEALRTDAEGHTSVVVAPCSSYRNFELPSPDGAKTIRLESRARPMVMMAPILNLFVEDATTRERWFVDSGWRGGGAGSLASWSARGHRLLVEGGRPLLYEADTHRVWAVHETGLAWAIDADGRRVAAAQRDGTVRVLTIGSHDEPIALPAASDWATLLALAGDRVAAVTQHGSVTVWDVARREIVGSWDAGMTPFQAAWCGDGTLLAMADADQVRLSRPDGSHPVTLTALRAAGATTWLARDEQGAFDGPPEALGVVRWLAPEPVRE